MSDSPIVDNLCGQLMAGQPQSHPALAASCQPLRLRPGGRHAVQRVAEGEEGPVVLLVVPVDGSRQTHLSHQYFNLVASGPQQNSMLCSQHEEASRREQNVATCMSSSAAARHTPEHVLLRRRRCSARRHLHRLDRSDYTQRDTLLDTETHIQPLAGRPGKCMQWQQT